MLPGDIVDRFPCRGPLFRFVQIIVGHRNLLLPRGRRFLSTCCPAFVFALTQFRTTTSFSYPPLLRARYLLQGIVHGLLANDDYPLFPALFERT